jgi:hypothetical protein
MFFKIFFGKCYEHLYCGQFHNHHCCNCGSVRKCIFILLVKSEREHSADFECMHNHSLTACHLCSQSDECTVGVYTETLMHFAV